MGCSASVHSMSNGVLNAASSCYGSNANFKSIQIEEELKVHQEYRKLEIKLLLLGAAEAGKSTIVKQVLISNQRFTIETTSVSQFFQFLISISYRSK